MNFITAVKAAWKEKNSLLCVGLDPDITRTPSVLSRSKTPLFDFCRAIVDATADLVCAYKPQIAYFSAVGAENELAQTIDYIHTTYPEIPVILDAKRGDIGATSKMYAKEAFDRYNADAVTINPYMGSDTLEPFLDRKDKGVIVLCRTSNPGAADIQDLEVNGEKLYRIVADKAVTKWNYNKNLLLVVGATYPEELKMIRSIIGDIPLLIPGVGAQGGDVGKAVTNGKTQSGNGVIINSSRGIIYAGEGAGEGDDFSEAARKAAISLRDEINQYR